MIRVIAVKNGKEIAWFKDLQPGIESIIKTCEKDNLDIKEYELRHYEEGNILWSGKKYTENRINKKL